MKGVGEWELEGGGGDWQSSVCLRYLGLPRLATAQLPFGLQAQIRHVSHIAPLCKPGSPSRLALSSTPQAPLV